MTLPTVIGFVGSALTLLVIVWGGFFQGREILYPAFLYHALFVCWFAGLALYYWANYTQIIHARTTHLSLKRELDNIVIDAPDVSQKELARIIEPNVDKRTKKPKVEIIDAEELQIEPKSGDE